MIKIKYKWSESWGLSFTTVEIVGEVSLIDLWSITDKITSVGEDMHWTLKRWRDKFNELSSNTMRLRNIELIFERVD